MVSRLQHTAHTLLVGRPRLIASLVVAIALVAFAGAGWASWFSYDLTAGLPDQNALRGLGEMAQSTTILDRADRPAFTIYKEQRLEVPIEKVSPNLIKAVVAVEDQRFYEHNGVDAIRVAAAFLNNLHSWRRSEGGSTITQQLARQSFLTPDKTYRRKLKEVILAAYIENLYTKQDILEFYLNKVYFGDGLYGVEAAARGYLAKSAADLTLDEASLLAGLIQSPSAYAPTVNLERAIVRRGVVLQAMVSSGVIDAPTAERARRARVVIANSLEIKETYGLYFKEQVRRELVERFGWQRVYQGGLRVYTTLDSELQRTAEAIVERGLVDIEKRKAFKHPARGKQKLGKAGEAPDYLQGALVSLDPSNGEVRAMVGGRDFGESRFNRAVQAKRQTGSAFKPFVYAAALEAGYSPASLITRLNDPILTTQGAWMPEDEHSTAGSMTLRTALRTSSNRAAVQLLNSVGIPRAVDYAKRMNVGTPPSVPSLALGTGDVTLVSLTAAYGAFAAGGMVRTPVLIRRVEDRDGQVLYVNLGDSHRAISEATAFMMASMLSDVINAGTAYRARQVGFTLPAAGKTGTTNDYMDAWFVGFTPHLVTGVWIGFDRPSTIIAQGYAGELAVPIWASVMRAATKKDKPDWFQRPPNVIGVNVCRLSGKLPGGGCDSVDVVSSDGFTERKSMVYTEYFLKGTEATETCDLHSSSFLDRITAAFGKHPAPAPADRPAAVAHAPAPPASAPVPTATAGATPAYSAPPMLDPAPEERPAKKPGFWGRLFGKGGKKDSKRDDEQKDEKKKKPAKSM
jgi:penicillin-binding protein 1A